MLTNLHPDGRMTYKYWPSRGNESSANNMIRQWMATLALIRIAQRQDNPSVWEKVNRNIEYNLTHFYKEEHGYGLIAYRDKVKLGALAIAALAIAEHPKGATWSNQYEALLRTIDTLWNPDGSFRTFYVPPNRNDNQNFYPGEALLLWATLYDRDQDPRRLQRIMRSFAYYRSWHLDERHRNPAFVPWHTQAYYLVWTRTKDPRLQAFIFKMNDWLLNMQQESSEAFPDIEGRFYRPDRPDYGPPHASSTGVYLEGLADAYQLACRVRDLPRRNRYRLAILRGLRSAMQLQFADDIDMYYISKRYRVRGGIRTTVYNNEIRVDNVQHNLMAAFKILAAFHEHDYEKNPKLSLPEEPTTADVNGPEPRDPN